VRMPQLTRDIIKERARRLRTKGEEALRRHLDTQVGATRRVLSESRELGRTEHFTQVRLAAPIKPGVVVDLAIAGHDGRQLIAA
jgi:threonylcarbamoyladenosine tRNA methylthiotransferase MtaB